VSLPSGETVNEPMTNLRSSGMHEGCVGC